MAFGLARRADDLVEMAARAKGRQASPALTRAARRSVRRTIRLLEKGRLDRKHPKEHHLRQWYALADLYERAGDIPRARDLFGRVASLDPDAFDVRDRLRALR